MTTCESEISIRTLAVGYRAKTRLESHHHSWGQLVFAASGSVRVISRDATWLLPPTRAIWLPDEIDHAIEMQSDVAMRTLYLAPKWATQMPGTPRAIAVDGLLRQLILHILSIGILYENDASHGLKTGLLIELILTAREEDLSLPIPRDPRALRLAKIWQDCPADPRSLTELANSCGASVRSLQRLFYRETGLTIQSWRQKARLVHAIASLASGKNVKNASYACGYQSTAAFGAAFRKQFGVAPSHYFVRPTPQTTPHQ